MILVNVIRNLSEEKQSNALSERKMNSYAVNVGCGSYVAIIATQVLPTFPKRKVGRAEGLTRK